MEHAKAIQCGRCEYWYQAHNRCGKELEVVHEWLMILEGKKLKVVPMNWTCRQCEEEENKRTQEREDKIMKLKSERK